MEDNRKQVNIIVETLLSKIVGQGRNTDPPCNVLVLIGEIPKHRFDDVGGLMCMTNPITGELVRNSSIVMRCIVHEEFLHIVEGSVRICENVGSNSVGAPLVEALAVICKELGATVFVFETCDY